MQQPIYSFITSSQEQISKKINENLTDKSKQDKLHEDLTDFLNKYKTSSSYKGQYSENLLETTLNNLYPSAHIQNTHALKASGDFIIRREDNDDILIENKDYKVNVDIAEIKKFLRDVTEQKTHGIFLSQFSGIVSKPNFFIEIHDGKVLVYLHNVEYNSDKINTAVNIIDNLSAKLSAINDAEEENGFSINKELLEKINKELQEFLIHKETISNNIKEFYRRLLPDIDKLAFPTLSTYLNTKYASAQNTSYCCNICGSFFPDKRALGSHKKVHKKSQDNVTSISIDTN
jgi:rubrerythrin